MAEEVINETEQAGLFYKALCRRPLIDVVPEPGEAEAQQKMFSEANDLTLYSWRNDWLKNTKDNLQHFGYFNRDHSVKVFFNEMVGDPVILVGAGPSLEKNIQYLKLAKEKKIPIMANHHALMYLAREEVQVKPDYVCVLDAGKMWDNYFAFDKMDYKDVPLLADQTCNTEHLKKWPGPIFFYKSATPDGSAVGKLLKMEMDRFVNPLKQGSLVEVGGHVAGAMLSIVRGIMQAETVIFAGSDYCYAPGSNKFYPFDHKIDQVVTVENHMGELVEAPAPPPAHGMIIDIFGNQVATNTAYLGFKNVMDIGIRIGKMNALQSNQSIDFINATEGGALGSLVNGNSKWMHYMRLEEAIHFADAKRNIKGGK